MSEPPVLVEGLVTVWTVSASASVMPAVPDCVDLPGPGPVDVVDPLIGVSP